MLSELFVGSLCPPPNWLVSQDSTLEMQASVRIQGQSRDMDGRLTYCYGMSLKPLLVLFLPMNSYFRLDNFVAYMCAVGYFV
jgi:hypothetical protein